jgi:hypothetical protein
VVVVGVLVVGALVVALGVAGVAFGGRMIPTGRFMTTGIIPCAGRCRGVS